MNFYIKQKKSIFELLLQVIHGFILFELDILNVGVINLTPNAFLADSYNDQVVLSHSYENNPIPV